MDKSTPLIQFGPLCAQLVGNHAVAKWAAKTFAPRHELDTADVGLVIEFVGRSLPKPQIQAKSFRFNGRFFQCQIETGSQWRMYVRATKGDSLTLGLRKPNLAWKTWLSHGTSLEVLWLKEFCYQYGVKELDTLRILLSDLSFCRDVQTCRLRSRNHPCQLF